MGVRTLDHTADLGIEVEAEGLGSLFSEAARGFAETMVDVERLEERCERRVSVDGRDLESLMVDWLSELLYLFEVEGEVYVRVTSAVERVGDGWRLEARCRGDRFDVERHHLKVPIKAVTYHGLTVSRRGERTWQARVIFDI